MSQQQEFTPLRLDRFGSLPVEIHVKIMRLLTTNGLLSLIRASPVSWRRFRGDHAFILESHLTRTYDFYGHPACIRLLMPLTLLRVLRAQLRGNPRAEVEKKLDPCSYVTSISALCGVAIRLGIEPTHLGNGYGLYTRNAGCIQGVERHILPS
ncbi:hypothetical protein FOZG_14452 [Fusarium oxysporum Fo47]|uniref:F-box domain-containing protein n=1 Tax=Fusarium oxysporum Fo47 TaxID=660027 RepID=W9JLM1_FUSOX|nr:hypothetical protein FOZG_14452 [Fusarium oxysporum Fo47]